MKSKKKLSEKVLAKKGLSIWNVELLVSNFSLNLTGVYANGFVISAYLVEVLNANSAFVGIMAALAMLPNTLLPFTSFIINKLKKKKNITIACLLVGRLIFLGALFYGFMASRNGVSKTTPMIVILLCLFGALVSSFTGAVNSWLSDLLPDNERSQRLAFRNIIINTGAVLGIFASSLVLKNFESNIAFPILFAFGAISFISSAIIFFYVYEPEHKDYAMQINTKEVFKEAMVDKNFRSFLVVCTLSTFAVFTIYPFLTIFYLEYFKAPYDIIGYMTAGTMFIIVLGVFFWAKFMLVIGARLLSKITITFLAILPLTWFLVPKDNYMIPMLVIALLYSFVYGGWTISITSSGFSMSDKSKGLIYISIYSGIFAICQAVAPIFAGIIADLYSTMPIFAKFQLPHPIMLLFIVSSFINIVCLIIYPKYKVERENNNLHLRHLLFRLDFALVFSRLANAAFMPYYMGNRKKLAQNMAKIKSSSALIPLIKLLHDLEQDVRLEAIEAIGIIASRKAKRLLVDFYEEGNLIEKYSIIKAFSNFQDKETEKILIEIYTSDYTHIKAEAAYSLAKRKSENAKEIALWSLINNTEKDEYSFLWHLAILASNRAVEVLPIIIPYYKEMNTSKHREYTLYYLSVIIGIDKEYYHTRNIEGEHEVKKDISQMTAALREFKVCKKNKELLRNIRIMRIDLVDKAEREEDISFVEYKDMIVSILEQYIVKEILEIIKYFLEQEVLTVSEIEFTTLAIRTLVHKDKKHILDDIIKKIRKARDKMLEEDDSDE